MTDDKKTGLELLRAPFPKEMISKLPKPTKQQTEIVRNDFKKGIRCKICNGWHHPNVVHLDYVGHAALTKRLLDCDPDWNWKPMALEDNGLPLFSKDGLWIKLTICGITRLGFGDAQGKNGGNAVKEIIGDALRNAAMRFGAALDLWSKSDLHMDEHNQDEKKVNNLIGPFNKTILKQALRDLADDFNHLTVKDDTAYVNGLWEDRKPALDQAKVDLPEWYDAAVKGKKKTIERINPFPGDVPDYSSNIKKTIEEQGGPFA